MQASIKANRQQLVKRCLMKETEAGVTGIKTVNAQDLHPHSGSCLPTITWATRYSQGSTTCPMLQVFLLQPSLPVSKPLPPQSTPQHGGENGRSDWLLFHRHVTGSHEDMVWSVWHQFNDVPDFFPIPFGVFDRPPLSERESGNPAELPNTCAHIWMCVYIQTLLSLCCWLHTQERGDAARLHSMRKWT